MKTTLCACRVLQQISLITTIWFFMLLLLWRLRRSFSRQSVGLLVASVAGVTWNVYLQEDEERERKSRREKKHSSDEKNHLKMEKHFDGEALCYGSSLFIWEGTRVKDWVQREVLRDAGSYLPRPPPAPRSVCPASQSLLCWWPDLQISASSYSASSSSPTWSHLQQTNHRLQQNSAESTKMKLKNPETFLRWRWTRRL